MRIGVLGSGDVAKVVAGGNARMVDPQYAGGKPTMFICGNDDAARAIEPLCMLWCIPGFLNNQWTHAFKLLT